AAVLAALAAGLPAETFVAGDSGVKWIGVRHAVRHPGSPLEIATPGIGGAPAPFVEPFFLPHDDHLHAVTSEPFVLATAPFYALLGPRGLYVLPLAGFLAAVAGWIWLARELDPRRHTGWLAGTLVLGTPWLFYGLEFWEHTPALGLAAIGTALLVGSWGFEGPQRTRRVGLGGALLGLAMVMRLEMACFAAAVFAMLPWLGAQRRGWRATAAAAAGAAAPLAVLVSFNLAHYGHVWNTHIAANAGLLGDGYIASRAGLVGAWFATWNDGSFWRAAPLAVVALAAPFVLPVREGGRAALLLMAGATTAMIVATAPNDGGGHWAPRYLLCVYGPLAVLASDVLQALGRRRAAGLGLALVILAGGAWTQRASYRKLQATKRIYGRMLAFVRQQAPPGTFVVTDLWWLDQVTAGADARTFLYAATREDGRAIFERLGSAHAAAVTIVVSRAESIGALPEGETGCYVAAGRAELPDRELIAIRLAPGHCP
ncbi:MAG: hypothetical protein AB7I13_07000, partial [Vicinamibacterales bacterium]